MSSLYLKRMVALAAQQGRHEEQQLIGRWTAELEAFLGPATQVLLNGSVGLEIGIEDSLALKLTLKTVRLAPTGSLQSMMAASPALIPWGRHVMDNQLRFHCGIKLTPERMTREIYAYPCDYTRLRELIQDPRIQTRLEEMKPLGLGIDDHRGYSVYFTSPDTHWVQVLQKELGLEDWHATRIWAWQQLRFVDGEAVAGKTALELRPLSPAVLARFASHYPFPYFRYLLPLREYHHGNFGRDPATGRFALYAMVN